MLGNAVSETGERFVDNLSPVCRFSVGWFTLRDHSTLEKINRHSRLCGFLVEARAFRIMQTTNFSYASHDNLLMGICFCG